MITQEQFGHKYLGIINSMKRINSHILVFENAVQGFKDERDFLTGQLDELHKEIYPQLPEEVNNVKNR